MFSKSSILRVRLSGLMRKCITPSVSHMESSPNSGAAPPQPLRAGLVSAVREVTFLVPGKGSEPESELPL